MLPKLRLRRAETTTVVSMAPISFIVTVVAIVAALMFLNQLSPDGASASDDYDVVLESFEEFGQDSTLRESTANVFMDSGEMLIVFEANSLETNGISRPGGRACLSDKTCICACIDNQCKRTIDDGCRTIAGISKVIVDKEVSRPNDIEQLDKTDNKFLMLDGSDGYKFIREGDNKGIRLHIERGLAIGKKNNLYVTDATIR